MKGYGLRLQGFRLRVIGKVPGKGLAVKGLGFLGDGFRLFFWRFRVQGLLGFRYRG